MRTPDFSEMSDEAIEQWYYRCEELARRTSTAQLEKREEELMTRGFDNRYLPEAIRVMAESHGMDMLTFVFSKPDWRYMIDLSEHDHDEATAKLFKLMAAQNALIEREM